MSIPLKGQRGFQKQVLCKNGHNYDEVGRSLGGSCRVCLNEWKRKNFLKSRRKPGSRWSFCKYQAKKFKFEFSIPFEEYSILIQQKCFYCDDKIGCVAKETGRGLDRIDNNKGYTIDNVLPCCGDCNFHKQDTWTVQEAKVAIQAVLYFRGI
jgi:hypothetical protein